MQVHGTNGVPCVLAPFPKCEPPNLQLCFANQGEKVIDRSEKSYHGVSYNGRIAVSSYMQA